MENAVMRNRTRRPGFMVYHSSRWMMDLMSDEDLGRVFRALIDYSMYGPDAPIVEMNEDQRRVFEVCVTNIDRDDVNYYRRISQNRKNSTEHY